MTDTPFNVFISYSRKDEDLKDDLLVHLASLKRDEDINPWQDRDIVGGEVWDDEIKHALEDAHIVLLLITPQFLNSSFCYDREMKRAMERHEDGKAQVVPIIMKPCDWQTSPFSKLQVLPKDALPVTRWDDQDEALLDVVKGLRRIVKSLRQQSSSAPSQTSPALSGRVSSPSESTPSTSRRNYQVQINWKLTLEGSLSKTFDDAELIKALQKELRELSQDSSLIVEKFEEGSIVLTLKGTEDGFRVIDSLYKNGELTRILGLRIEHISLIPESTVIPKRSVSSTAKRIALINTLSSIPTAQFEMLIFALDIPAANTPSSTLSPGQRASELLNWAKSSAGCGLDVLEETLNQVINP